MQNALAQGFLIQSEREKEQCPIGQHAHGEHLKIQAHHGFRMQHADHTVFRMRVEDQLKRNGRKQQTENPSNDRLDLFGFIQKTTY